MLKGKKQLAVVVNVIALAIWSATYASTIELPWAFFSSGGVSVEDSHRLVRSISSGQLGGTMVEQT